MVRSALTLYFLRLVASVDMPSLSAAIAVCDVGAVVAADTPNPEPGPWAPGWATAGRSAKAARAAMLCGHGRNAAITLLLSVLPGRALRLSSWPAHGGTGGVKAHGAGEARSCNGLARKITVKVMVVGVVVFERLDHRALQLRQPRQPRRSAAVGRARWRGDGGGG